MESIASLSLKADTTSMAAAGPVLDQISAKTLLAEQAAKKMAIAYNLLAEAGKDTSAIKTQEAVGNSMLAAERNTIRYYESWVKAANEAAAASAKAAQAATPQGIFKAAGVRSPEDTARELDQLRQAKALWEEAGRGAEGYAGQIGHITARINTLTEGNARARGALRQTASAMASLAFEAAGAAFLVTAVVSAIAAPVLPGVGLMRTVEDTRLGMAAILVSMGRINGAAPSLPTALQISSGMMDKLVNDSMRFGVSIEALANTLRSTLAPGLAAGMSLKQIQEIATIGTIAVKTIGLDSKQTVQEIRDLVAGGIQAASSTLATSIGVKDSDIKRWREAGTLYEELMKKLQGFASASEESTKTLTGAWEVLKTKIALLMSDESGFGALKEILLGVSGYIGQIDEKTKKMVFNPALVESAKTYWELLKSIGSVLKQIGAIIEVLTPAMGAFAKGASTELGKVASFLDGLIGKSATWETRMIAAARAMLNLSSLPGVIKALSEASTPGEARGPQSSGLITGLPKAGEVTGDLSAAGNKMRDELLVGLKHTREGLQAEYEKIIQNTISFERNLKMRRINLQIQSAEPRTGKAAEDYAVNYAAELSAIVAGENTLAQAKTEARRSLNEKLAALDKKENKPTDAYLASIQTLNGLYKQEERDSEAHLRVLATQHRTALLGDIGYENQRYEEELRSLENRKALRTQEMQNAERAKQPEAVAKRLSEINQITSQEENAARVHAAKLTVISEQQQRDLDRINIGGMKARGDLVGAYEAEFGLKNLSDQKRHQADLALAQETGNAEWIAREEKFLADLAAARAAGLGGAQFDQVKLQFDAALSEMQAALARVKLAAEQDEGLAAAVNAQGLAKDITDKALPALDALQQKMAALAPAGDAGRAKAAADDITKIATEAMKMRAFADSTAKAWVSAGDSIANSLTKAFGAGGKAVGDMVKVAAAGIAKQTKLDSDYAAAKMRGDADLSKLAIKYQNDTSENTLGSYGDMAGAAASYFDKQSNAYKALHAVEQAMYLMKFAMQAQAMAMDATATGSSVANSGIRATADGIAAFAKTLASLPFPYNLAAGAVVVGALAAVGVSLSGGGGGGSVVVPSDATAEGNQKTQGTGTVLGDATAKSATIANGIDILAKHSFEMLDYDNKMLTALQNIDRGMEGLASALVQVGGITGTGAISAFGTVEQSSSSPGFFGIGASTSNTNIADTGITIKGTVAALAQATGIIQQYETVVETWTDSGFFGIGADSGTNINTHTKALVGEVPRQISLIFESMSNSIKEGIGLLGLAADDTEMQAIMATIAAVPIDLKVSLKGLSGEDIKNALNGIFSKAFDNMVSAIAPWAEEFQKVGEGVGETFIRLAADARLVNLSLKSVGAGSFDDAFKAGTTGQTFATYQQSANVQSARADVTAAEQALALAQALPSVIVGLDDFGVASIQAGANVAAITAAQLELDAANARLNSTLADMGPVTDTYAQALVRAREYLLDGAGGADAFAEKWQFFTDNFISDSVKLAAVQDSVNAAFANMSAGTDGGLPGLGKQLSDLGYAIPKTNDEFAALVLKATNAAAGVGDFAESNADLTNTLLNLAPAFNQVQQAAQEAANSLHDYLEENFYTEAERKTRRTAIGLLELTAVLGPLGLNTHMSHAEFLALLPTLGLSAEAANNLAHSFVDVNGSAQDAADSVAEVVKALDSITSFSSGSISESAAAQVEKISQTVSKSMSGASYSTSTSAQISALTELVRKSQFDLSKTPGGPGYSANRNYFEEVIRQANQQVGGLVKDLTDYTLLEAQYTGKGKQLLDLQKWNEEQTKLYRNNGISMVALEQEYQRQRLAIISGGNAAATDSTAKFADTLSAWLRGLDQSAALSPLTAAQQQAEAETQYVLDIARANAGDAAALANITKDAELYLSTTKAVTGFGGDYSAVYSKVKAEVGMLANSSAGRPVTAEDINALRLEIADEKAVIARLLEKGNAEAKAAAAELVAAVATNTQKTVAATANASVLTETA